MKNFRILAALVTLGIFAAISAPSSALACGGKACQWHAAKGSKAGRKTAQVTKSGRKLECTKCAEHAEEARAEPSDASAPSKTEEKKTDAPAQS